MENSEGKLFNRIGKILDSKPLVLQPTHRHKIDADKIKSVDDIIQILSRLDLRVNDEGLKGIEHLIADDND